jgi:hypothetical protein
MIIHSEKKKRGGDQVGRRGWLAGDWVGERTVDKLAECFGPDKVEVSLFFYFCFLFKFQFPNSDGS